MNSNTCDAAQAAINDYVDMIHTTFHWKSTCNKAHYLEQRAVAIMRKRGSGLTLFSEQAMESSHQPRKKSSIRTRHMNKLKGLKCTAFRLMVDKFKYWQQQASKASQSRKRAVKAKKRRQKGQTDKSICQDTLSGSKEAKTSRPIAILLDQNSDLSGQNDVSMEVDEPCPSANQSKRQSDGCLKQG